jgi:single-strand DNA-binding protein
MLNKTMLMGRLTANPELRRTANGKAVCSYTLAVERDRKDDNGNRLADFIDVVAWEGAAEFVAKNFTKGKMCALDGRLQIRDWTDKDGNKRRNAEVVVEHVYFCGSQREGAAPHPSPAATPSPQGEGFEEVEEDGELPF